MKNLNVMCSCTVVVVVVFISNNILSIGNVESYDDDGLERDQNPVINFADLKTQITKSEKG